MTLWCFYESFSLPFFYVCVRCNYNDMWYTRIDDISCRSDLIVRSSETNDILDSFMYTCMIIISPI